MQTKGNTYFFSLILCVIVILAVMTGCHGAASLELSEAGVYLDDPSYTINKDGDGFYVDIPSGHPRVPQVICEEGQVFQAFFPEGENQAIARVVLEKKTFEIAFRKTPELGFNLQYDDRYTFKPTTLAPAFFTSSDPLAATVSQDGVITIVGVSQEPVTITAGSGSSEETFVIDKIEKAPLNVFLLTGQSNAAYYYAEPENAPVTKLGTSYQYDEVEGGGVIRSLNNPDGTMLVGSIEASLCKTLYENTQEKTLIINAGISGKSLRTFKPFSGDSYITVEKIWRNATSQISTEEFFKGFEPRLRSYIWVHGEIDDKTDPNKYMDQYELLHQVFVSSNYYNLDYGFISLVNAKFSRPAEAQEMLAQAYDDIIMGTRASQYFSVEGGEMRGDDLHYAQAGDNILGKELAETIIKVYSQGTDAVNEGEGDYLQ